MGLFLLGGLRYVGRVEEEQVKKHYGTATDGRIIAHRRGGRKINRRIYKDKQGNEIVVVNGLPERVEDLLNNPEWTVDCVFYIG